MKLAISITILAGTLCAAMAFWLLGPKGEPGPRPRPLESLSPQASPLAARSESAAPAQTELATLNSADFLADRDLPVPAQGLRILLQDQASQSVSSAEVSLYVPRTDVPLLPGSIPAPDTRHSPFFVCRTTTGVYDFAELPQSKFVMVVQADQLHGSAWFEHPEKGSTHVVTLKPARSVTIRAVDSARRPLAGVRVQPTAIFALAEPKRTDAEGRASWPLDPADPALFYASQFKGRAFRDDTGALLAVGPPVSIADAGPTEDTLVLPVAACLRIQVQTPEGEPFGGPWLLSARESHAAVGSLEGKWAPSESMDWSFTGSETSVYGVEPHASYELLLESQGFAPVRKVVRVSLDPQAPPCIFEVPDRLSVVEIPILRPSEAPVGLSLFFVDIRYPDLHLTDAGGVLPRHFPRPPLISARLESHAQLQESLYTKTYTPSSLELSVLPKARVQVVVRPGRDAAHLSIEIPPLEPGARYKSAPLQLATESLTAAGIVCDAAGKSVPNALVELFAPGGPAPASAPFFGASAGSAEALKPLVSRRTDSQGRFRFSTSLPHGAYDLVASAEGQRSGVQRLRFGAIDHVLNFEPAGSLSGKVSHGFALDLPIQVQLRALDRMRPHEAPRSHFVKSGEPFKIESIAPGLYVAEFRVEELLLSSIAVVEIRAGEVTRDPRLEDLQIGAEAELCELQLVERSGAPITKPEVIIERVRKGESELSRILRTMHFEYEPKRVWSSSVPILRYRGEPVDLHLLARGYAPRQVSLVGGKQTVVLSRLAALRVVIDGLAAFLEEQNNSRELQFRLLEVNAVQLLSSSALDAAEGLVAMAPIENQEFLFAKSSPTIPLAEAVPVERGSDDGVFALVSPGSYVITLERGRRIHVFGTYEQERYAILEGAQDRMSLQTIEIDADGPSELRVRIPLTEALKRWLRTP